MSHSLSPEWLETLSLARRRPPEFCQAKADIQPGPHADAIEFALGELGLAAVFCIEGVPTIGFVSEPNISPKRIDTVHRVLWNQGLMSLLLVIKDDELTAYSLVQGPSRHSKEKETDPRLIKTLSLISDSLKLRELIDSTESGRFWYENEDYFDPANRVDSVLLGNLFYAFRELKDDLGSEGAQALLMQAMFVAYLEDRKLIKKKVFQDTSDGAYTTFDEVLLAPTTTSFTKLFAWLKQAFNGNVFNAPCAFDNGDSAPPKVTTKHLRILERFRHGHEDMPQRQHRLWGYDFEHMPISLISAVYDRFLKEEAIKKNADGAFYTPMFLADVVVSQVWDDLSEEQQASGVFCDPACGSGVFLVRLFQRLVANHCRIKKKRHATWKELTAIARRVHGADINPSAVRIAAFSLYIALLEQSNPPDLRALIGQGKLLPSLYRDTLRPAEDFFETSDVARYDAIVGNPPWKGRSGQVTSAKRWSNAQDVPIPANDIAWGFVWKSLQVLKPQGLVGLLLPAMGVLHNVSKESIEARQRLLNAARVERIINFSDLCFQLFEGAQRPTALVLYRHAQFGGLPYRFEYWCPKADLNLRLKRLLTLSRSDRTHLRSDHVKGDPAVFKRRLWTRSPEEKLLQYLRNLPALSALVRQFKELRSGEYNRDTEWVIGQGFKPAQPHRISDPAYQTTSAQAVTLYPYLAADEFKPLALPTIRTNPWNDIIVHRAGFTDGFLGPHILVPQGVERSVGRVRATYTEQSLVFEHSLQAISFPPKSRGIAKLLTAILNSRLAAWFYFHETANLGTDRAKVVQSDLLKLPFATAKRMPNPRQAEAAARKVIQLMNRVIRNADELLQSADEQFSQIDSLVYDYYGLDAQDVALIEDTYNYIIPAMQPRRNAGIQEIWNSSKPEHRKNYAATLCDALKPWFRKPITASLAAKSGDFAVLRLTIDRSRKNSAYHEVSVTDANDFLRKISWNLPKSLPGNFQLTPDLRFVIGRDMYLVKPMQLRHWLRSVALADADAIAAEFSAINARSDGQKAYDAHR